jgi:hypothetical protein
MVGHYGVLLVAILVGLACERNETSQSEFTKIAPELSSAQAPSLPSEPVAFQAPAVSPEGGEGHGLDSATGEGNLGGEANLAEESSTPSDVPAENMHKNSGRSPRDLPAFLARDCSAQNEGEMGFNAKEKRAYYCNGSQWVKLSKKLLKEQSISGLNLENMNDQSFLCQKSSTGGFRCMKATTFKNAH